MPVNYFQLKNQIDALLAEEISQNQNNAHLLQKALNTLDRVAEKGEWLRSKVNTVFLADRTLRCAGPGDEILNTSFPLPVGPLSGHLLASDGSQIFPNYKEPIPIGLINISIFDQRLNSPEVPVIVTNTQLFLPGHRSAKGNDFISEEWVAGKRDVYERVALIDFCDGLAGNVVAVADGTLEVWGSRTIGEGEYNERLDATLEIIRRFQERQPPAILAGYVDQPRGNPVVRLLEIAELPDERVDQIGFHHPFRGLRDTMLFSFVPAGHRSAIFSMESRSGNAYPADARIHFFYLNVGEEDDPILARVEVPAWVVQNREMIDSLHAVLVEQCHLVDHTNYPYCLLRAHEEAVITYSEKGRIMQMLLEQYIYTRRQLNNFSPKLQSKRLLHV